MSHEHAGFLLLASLAAIRPAAAQPLPTALAIVEEFDRRTSPDLWPGFDPMSIPLAIYDGRRTWLFRHPHPPPAFTAVADRPDATVFEGRHVAAVANTQAEIDGVSTAIIVIDPAGPSSARSYAALLVHEAFHVFQREAHPSWGGREADLLTYPVHDTVALALRRLETEALRRAVAAHDPEAAACWGGRALALRRDRFDLLPDESVAFERGTEQLEGLADYVEGRVLSDTPVDPFAGWLFAADDVRFRSYAAGAAIALLLDRLSPDWRGRLEREDTLFLDALLAGAADRPAATCALSQAQRDSARAWAREAAVDLAARRSALRVRITSQPGWTVIVETDGEPLRVQQYDPWNAHAVADGELVHTRVLALSGAGGTVRVRDRDALTEAAGPHPLFTGVRRVTVAGLAEPSVLAADAVTVIRADGFEATLRDARIDRRPDALRIVASMGRW